MIGLLIFLALWGLVAGALARFAVPGPDPMPIWGTIALGVAGTWIGGSIAWLAIGHAGGFIFSVLGSVLLLIAYRRFVQHRPITGPGARRLPPPR